MACCWPIRYSSPSEALMGEIAEPTPAETELARHSVFAGRYKIKSLLGEGDRKRTYLAEDRLLGRVVALSVIKPAAAQADPEAPDAK